jgi:hypothetical protein
VLGLVHRPMLLLPEAVRFALLVPASLLTLLLALLLILLGLLLGQLLGLLLWGRWLREGLGSGGGIWP